jgi:hypothetical protein
MLKSNLLIFLSGNIHEIDEFFKKIKELRDDIAHGHDFLLSKSIIELKDMIEKTNFLISDLAKHLSD